MTTTLAEHPLRSEARHLGADLFLLPFPSRVRVVDSIDKLMFMTVADDDGKDLKQLIAHAVNPIPIQTAATMHRERLDLAKVRQQEREAAAALLKYMAEVKANPAGAITSVVVQVDSRFSSMMGA
jgi:hypothetical protein